MTTKKENVAGHYHSNQPSKTANPISSRIAAVNKCIHLESQDVEQNNFAKAKAISKKPLPIPEQQQDFLTWLKESDAEVECEPQPKWSYELGSQPSLSLLARRAIAIVRAGGIL
jgi:hypothetical protein